VSFAFGLATYFVRFAVIILCVCACIPFLTNILRKTPNRRKNF